jgi:hypothetical protein
MALLVWAIMPIAKDNDVIPLDRIHTDMHRIFNDPKTPHICPWHMHVTVPPISGELQYRDALEEANRNLPRQYASPAARRMPTPPQIMVTGRNHWDIPGIPKPIPTPASSPAASPAAESIAKMFRSPLTPGNIVVIAYNDGTIETSPIK